jgi:hypothetical protein
LYGWLREERHVLRSAEDATLDLAVPVKWAGLRRPGR